MTAVLVKVQLPVDLALAQTTGRTYADKANPNVLVYDRLHKHVFNGRDDRLRDFMIEAGDGVGFMKAFMMAEWHNDRWLIDYRAGFQPLAKW